MKNLHYMVFFVLFALCSCKKQNVVETLPVDKLYILEYNYSLPEYYPEYYEASLSDLFWVAGFCELDNDFNLKYARRVSHSGYFNSESVVPDSMRNKISNVLLKYQTDTTFLYTGEFGSRIYDGNRYRFIIQKHNQEDITIKFEPKYLPEDLKFVYSYLYDNREKAVHKSKYNELFEMFKNQVKDDEHVLPPPPLLKPTIKFTPPVIKGKK